ncbi:hypothetical protein [Natronospirillum operosum]|uniref:hypothetical protein n=1 Tax=Natronospirillum operosum TaxID=2759953 RepID=UPI0014368C54|nr:hypothetical protein [Natronospirillum operosum]
MTDDVILNKCATIERCVIRVIEEWERAGEAFDTDFTGYRQSLLKHASLGC